MMSSNVVEEIVHLDIASLNSRRPQPQCLRVAVDDKPRRRDDTVSGTIPKMRSLIMLLYSLSLMTNPVVPYILIE